MKFKNLILAGLALVSMAACSNEDDPQTTQEPQDVKAYMQISITGAEEHNSRTDGEATEVGSSGEQKINNLLVLLCDKKTKAVEFKYNVKTWAVDQKKTSSFLAKTGNYYVYVVANVPDDFANLGDVITDKKITQTINDNGKVTANDVAVSNSFWMFNESQNSEDVNGPEITITTDNDIANPATCSPIKLERLAVKIITGLKSDGEGYTINGTIGTFTINDVDNSNTKAVTYNKDAVTLQGIRLVNCINTTNLQQKWTNNAASAKQNWIVPLEVNKENVLDGTKIGFYNFFQDYVKVVVEEKLDKTKEYTTLEDKAYHYFGSTFEGMKGEGTEDPKQGFVPMYCLENCPTTPVVGNTTGVVYQYKLAISNSDNLAGTGCFYKYKDSFFSSLQAIYNSDNNAFNADGKTGEEAFNAAKVLIGAYVSASTPQEKSKALNNFRKKYLIKVYESGMMYYDYFIKDTNYTNVEGENYYGVLRNTVYKLTVTNLKKIGKDLPIEWNPEVKPDQPIEQENVYMNVTVIVNPWIQSNQDIELE